MSDWDRMREMYEAMDRRIHELPDTPAAMAQLLAEFPKASVQDWWMVFTYVAGNGMRVPPSWRRAEQISEA